LSATTTAAGVPVSRSASGSYSFSFRGHDRVAERQAAIVGQEDEPDAVHETVLRLSEAEAGEAGELAPLLAAWVVGDTDQRAVAEPHTARVEPAREPLLDDRDQPDQGTQAPVVLRLLGQMRKPARQYPPDQTEELPIGADPDRRLRDRERDQLGIVDQRLAAASRRDRVLVSEDIRCNDKGFQIVCHLEPPSRGDTSGSPPSS
jgi:hypothetical protein